jgi:cellulose synthase/poly-beta-1,6-N-acetylglucosamine synthase-like glycosyltransferase
MIELSVVIPSRNSEKTIEKTLKSIFSNNYPKDKYEVIVVDSSKNDISYIAKKFPIKFIRITHQSERTSNIQRNIGAKLARGKFVFYNDSDCIVPKKWMRTIVKYFNDEKVAVVGSGVETIGNIFDNYAQNSIGTLMRAFKKVEVTTTQNFHRRRWPLGANQAYRKNILKKMNYFDEKITFYEEVDLLWRIVEKNFKILSIPNAIVKHTFNKGFFEMLKTYFEYGRGCGYFCMKYPNASFSRMRILSLIGILIFFCSIIANIGKGFLSAAFIIIPISFLFAYYFSLINKNGIKSLFFAFFDVVFGLSYITGMILSIFIYPFKRGYK